MNGGHGVSADSFFRGMNGLDVSADSSFHPFPPSSTAGSAVNDSSSAFKPVMAFQESNRNGVMSALHSLQEKMRKLEVERRAAESSLQSLASETQLYKSSLHQPLFPHHPHQTTTTTTTTTTPLQEEEEGEEEGEEEEEEEKKNRDAVVELQNGHLPPKQLESQLSSAESRCQLLEKQLQYMRQIVHTSERDRTQAVHKVQALQHHHHHHHHQPQQQQQKQRQRLEELLGDPPSSLSVDYPTQMERIGELERDHVRLTVSKTLAESKIKGLEAKLREQRKRQALPEKTNQQPKENGALFQSQTVPHPSGNIRPPPPPPPSSSQRKKRGSSSNNSKKRKKKGVSRKNGPPVKSEPSQHYRLNLADIPFVAGKSTGPSHAVGANIQKVLSLMKSHNMALCCSSSSSSPSSPHIINGGEAGGVRRGRGGSPIPRSLPADLDLADLLAQLQDEFGQLTTEHQEYHQMLQEATDPHIHQDLQTELNTLMVRMEVKSQQIAKLRQHQERLVDVRRTSKRKSKNKPEHHVPRPTSDLGRLQSNPKYPHPQMHSGNLRPKSSSTRSKEPADPKHKDISPPSLNMLRDMRKLQTTLRRDDLCWE
ncbi:hypothetical protein ACOMHN_020080 [Nucella lapillus]